MSFKEFFMVNRNWLSSHWPVFSPAIVVLWFCCSKDLGPRPELPLPVVTFGIYGLAPSWTIAVCSRFLSLRLWACDPVSLGLSVCSFNWTEMGQRRYLFLKTHSQRSWLFSCLYKESKRINDHMSEAFFFTDNAKELICVSAACLTLAWCGKICSAVQSVVLGNQHTLCELFVILYLLKLYSSALNIQVKRALILIKTLSNRLCRFK